MLLLLWTLSSVVCVSTLQTSTAATHPGFQARITVKGLNYANSQAVNALAAKLSGQKIPDQSGKSGKVSYSVTGMVITSFSKPTSSINIVPNSGLKWSMSGAGISINGNWRYKYKKGWFKISDSGSFTADVSGASFSLSINVAEDSTGRPAITATSCSCNIHNINIKIHGSKVSWLYKLLIKVLKDKLKGILQKKLCDVAKEAVNVDAEKGLRKIPVNVDLFKKFVLNYSLISKPAFTASYLQTFHKGEIFWKGDSTEYPSPASEIPSSADNSKMVYFWLSDYMANSMGYAAFKHGFLKYNLTAKDLPADKRSVLNTTCSSLFCIGKIIPQIGNAYPNRQVKVNMVATSAPKMMISKAAIHVNATGTLDLYAEKPKTPEVFLIRLNLTLGFNLTPSLKGELLYTQVSDPQLKLAVLKSNIGAVSGSVIESLAKLAIKLFVIPMINKQGAKGLNLPVTDDVKFTQSQLVLQQRSLMVGTDLVYKPKSNEVTLKGELYHHLKLTEFNKNMKSPNFRVVKNEPYLFRPMRAL